MLRKNTYILTFCLFFVTQVYSQGSYHSYDFNSFGGPGEWVASNSNLGSKNGNMSFNMNGSLNSNSSNFFTSPRHDFSSSSNDLVIEYEVNIDIRNNEVKFLTDGCFLCVRNDELIISYLDTAWIEISSHSGDIYQSFLVNVPHTASKLRIQLDTDPGSLAGNSAEVYELSLDQPVSLPITLTKFEVIKVNGSAVLQWETESEVNNSHFIIERADGSGDFREIAMVEGNDNSRVKRKYELEDRFPLNGYNYYRLTQVDFNGRSEVFEPKAVYFEKNGTYSIFPNPSMGEISVVVQDRGAAELFIKNYSGTVLEYKNLHAGENLINISSYPPGYYFFTILQDQKLHTEKVLKL